MASSSSTAEHPPLEVLQWLKTLPVAPEYHPTLVEFQDPIAYIHKIEKEASQYGICKIVPPVPAAPKKTAIANLNRSFSALQKNSCSSLIKGAPTFTTRQQQIGFCPRRPRPVQKPVWQSGEQYTLQQFEIKAKQFERSVSGSHSSNIARRRSGGGATNSTSPLSPLEAETLFWKACADKPFSVEYANDMPGSGFNPLPPGKKWRDGEAASVGETAWNMRGVSRAKGSLLQFMKEDIPGVTSPMVYVAMMFSWFAWHVEDHDLHSLNYLHFGAGKTWYGVPRDARLAFEDIVRLHGYGGEVNPLVASAILGEKTTVMSPEVLVEAGIPCCRLVQNAGDFVVTFPGSYHSGFSLGFNCGEAANIATPEWLNVAKDAAIRRASINYPPMVSHYQLLYELALSLISRDSASSNSEPRSCRLKGRMKSQGEMMIKEQFVQTIIETNRMIQSLVHKGSSCVLLPRDSFDMSMARAKVKPRFSLSFSDGEEQDQAFDRNSGLKYLSHVCSMDGRFTSEKEARISSDGLLDQGLLSCVTCGILSFTCVAIIHPADPSASSLMSADSSSPMVGDHHDDAILGNADGQDCNLQEEETRKKQESALDLLVSTYGGDSSEGEEEIPVPNNFVSSVDCSAVSSDQNVEISEEIKSFNRSVPLMRKCDMDSCRMHIFCLEHALEVEKRLQSMGGSDLMIVCHPDYPKIEQEAKTLAEELGVECRSWGEIQFRDASKEDRKKICSAVEDGESVPKNSDWTVKLGINLFYSSNLCKSPLYSQQLPFNPIIYKAFGCDSSGNSPASLLKIHGKRSGKQKRISVAGKWCGKVWMSNQVHPFLARKLEILEEEDEEEDDEIAVMAEKKKKKKTSKATTPKKKKKKPKLSPVELPAAEIFSPATQRQRSERRRRPITRPIQEQEVEEEEEAALPPAKKAKKKQAASNGEEGDEYPCNLEGCNMSFRSKQDLALHKRNICPAKGCGKKFFSHKYLVHHQRVHVDDRPLKCPWKGCKMSFKWAWARTEHIRVHTGERPYVCKEAGCGQTFRFVSDFSRHKRRTGHISKKSKA